MDKIRRDKLIRSLEEKGYQQAKFDLNSGIYGDEKKKFVEHWINEQEKRLFIDLEKEKLEAAKEANNIANKNNKILLSHKKVMWIAAIISIFALFLSI